jgi:hypothetical protein
MTQGLEILFGALSTPVNQISAELDPSESAAIGFLDLAVQQVERHLPTEFARRPIRDPLTEMGRDAKK